MGRIAPKRSTTLLRSRAASAALEFAIVAIPFLTFLFAIIDSGLEEFYQLAFDEAVRNAARQIQVYGPAATSGPAFANAVCTEFSILAQNCVASISYTVQASTIASGFAGLSPVTLPASGQLANEFFSGTAPAQNVNVLVQAAYPLPFAIPFFSKLITGNGTNSILATTTLRIEPY